MSSLISDWPNCLNLKAKKKFLLGCPKFKLKTLESKNAMTPIKLQNEETAFAQFRVYLMCYEKQIVLKINSLNEWVCLHCTVPVRLS